MNDVNAMRRRRPTQQSTPSAMPDVYMPAMPPLGMISAMKRWVSRYWRRRQFRRRFLPLLAHDDHLLADLGYRRDDILRASRLPLTEDALQALEKFRERARAQHSDAP